MNEKASHPRFYTEIFNFDPDGSSKLSPVYILRMANSYSITIPDNRNTMAFVNSPGIDLITSFRERKREEGEAGGFLRGIYGKHVALPPYYLIHLMLISCL